MLRYRNGDVRAFETLYARHRGPLYRFLLSSCRDAELCRELFQNCWAGVVRARQSYHPDAQFRTWLFAIARNQLIDHARRNRVQWLELDEADGLHHGLHMDPAAGPDAQAEGAQQAARIAQALRALPAEQREAFLLQEDGELSLQEIAELTGTGRETVKSRLRYAIAKLREALADVHT